jgi:Protein of unknown function (DUF3485)
MQGKTPDGLLMRVSSIDDDAARAFVQQEQFIKELVAAVPAGHRARVTGVGDALL